MVNIKERLWETLIDTSAGALSAGLGAYLLAGKKIFNVQLITSSTSFAKGALIGSSIIVTTALIGTIIDMCVHYKLLPFVSPSSVNYWKLLCIVPLVAIPGYAYGRSSPITAISISALTILGLTSAVLIEETFTG